MQGSSLKTVGIIASFILVVGIVSILSGQGVPFTSADETDLNILLDQPVLVGENQITLDKSIIYNIENRLKEINKQMKELGVEERDAQTLADLQKEVKDLISSLDDLISRPTNSSGL